MNKYSLLLAAGLLVGITFQASAEDAISKAPESTGVVATNTNPESVVATVNGEPIRQKEVDKAFGQYEKYMQENGENFTDEQKKTMSKTIVDRLVERTLVLQQSTNIPSAEVSDKVNEQLTNITNQLGQAEYQQKLKESGMTEDDLKKEIATSYRLNEVIKNEVVEKIEIPDAEVKKYYEDHQDQFKEEEMIRASHILVMVEPNADEKTKKEKRAKIEKALERVKKGEDFAKVATEVSEEPGAAERGGDLDFFPRGAMVPPFEEAAFALKKGEISNIVETQFGYHIIKVTDRKEGGNLAFEAVKDQIKDQMKNERLRTALQDYSEMLKKNADIQYKQ